MNILRLVALLASSSLFCAAQVLKSGETELSAFVGLTRYRNYGASTAWGFSGALATGRGFIIGAGLIDIRDRNSDSRAANQVDLKLQNVAGFVQRRLLGWTVAGSMVEPYAGAMVGRLSRDEVGTEFVNGVRDPVDVAEDRLSVSPTAGVRWLPHILSRWGVRAEYSWLKAVTGTQRPPAHVVVFAVFIKLRQQE